MTQTVSAREVQAAGGLDKWAAKAAQGRPVNRPTPAETAATSRDGARVPQAKGRKPVDPFVGYDGERMNKLEAMYAAHLEALRRSGKIVFWRFESAKFRLADRTWYTPDFYIMRQDGTLEIHETKGFWEDDARVKIKVTAEQFPELQFVAVQWDKCAKGWRFERFRAVKGDL